MIQEVLKKIENSYYWDARVKSLDCNYFGDEVKLVFEDIKKDITYHFSGCYKVKIEHEIEYHKNIASKETPIKVNPYLDCIYSKTLNTGIAGNNSRVFIIPDGVVMSEPEPVAHSYLLSLPIRGNDTFGLTTPTVSISKIFVSV